ncbi:hypothetical protein FGO68_gene8456 [Halteria grandinella]|uniref:Tr-type G domain-containing protein n=1 Tax=Halteria grandinella TaxID=5974 RepID=A0A8J8NVJ5_HALGN|nr:hypothetical protein FGO68_gene8456 [Halteria grandinella]
MNINLGVLGHIDSGKTSLCRALSTIASTSAFDKSTQSRTRGITLDLGFSAFIIRIPDWFRSLHPTHPQLQSCAFIQFTLVDCPGHASLMKTIIGGASIIDMMMLVVDAQKLVQTQTAECIVLGELLMDRLVVAMNKVDMFASEERDKMIEQQGKKLRTRFAFTRFGENIPIIPVAANPKPEGAPEEKKALEEDPTLEEYKAAACGQTESGEPPIGVDELIIAILKHIKLPVRQVKASDPFMFSIDHCFQIKGQGTVMTGTVLSGQVKVGDNIELPILKQEKRVKSMQMFRKPVQSARQGDRLGICVAQLDAALIERGIATTPHSLHSTDLILAIVKKIPYFTEPVKNKSKFHITIGHQTVIGYCLFFTAVQNTQQMQVQFSKAALSEQGLQLGIESEIDYQFVDEVKGAKLVKQQVVTKEEQKGAGEAVNSNIPVYYAAIKLEREIFVQPQSLLIASKLDKDIAAKQCRLAFQGQAISLCNESPVPTFEKLKIVKEKLKKGKVDRVTDARNLIIRDLFQKETSQELFMNKPVTITLPEGVSLPGTIIGTFGKSGKQKVYLKDEVTDASVLEKLAQGEVELKIRVLSKEVAKIRNIKQH